MVEQPVIPVVQAVAAGLLDNQSSKITDQKLPRAINRLEMTFET